MMILPLFFIVVYILDQTSGLLPNMAGDTEHLLNGIHDITSNNIGSLCYHSTYKSVKFALNTQEFSESKEKAELARDFLSTSKLYAEFDVTRELLSSLVRSGNEILAGRLVTFLPTHTVEVDYQEGILKVSNSSQEYSVDQEPWYIDRFSSVSWRKEKFPSPQFSHGSWTFPYYSCKTRKWMISYTLPVFPSTNTSNFIGLLVMDLSVSGLDINQCEVSEKEPDSGENIIQRFQNTHKCHNTSKCIFQPGHGWVRGGYTCQCRKGYYPATGKNGFNGSLVEVAFSDHFSQGSSTYSQLYICIPCSSGCNSCEDSSPCIAEYNWGFRLVLLSISMFCIISSLITIFLVYKYRRLKVFKLSSPTFLSITLMGCAVMYTEMVVIYPVLNTSFCVLTKWARHLGFCITYTALLMKTWRVSLTYRVKSAHKLKLTDKQLLQWMVPILLIMIIYLSTWTVSDPPAAVDVFLTTGRKFAQCDYNWWDHSIALGELVFLLWGVRVCIAVRKARTFFNEATLISWSIYNIAIVNSIMASIHVIIIPNAGPDMKYFLGFLRTQLSTTTTMLLVFGPKVAVNVDNQSWQGKSRMVCPIQM